MKTRPTLPTLLSLFNIYLPSLLIMIEHRQTHFAHINYKQGRERERERPREGHWPRGCWWRDVGGRHGQHLLARREAVININFAMPKSN